MTKIDIKGRIPAVFDHRAGMVRREAEAAAIAEVKASGAVPSACGPDIPVAPARGAYRVFRPVEIVPGSSGTARPAGYRGPGEATFRAAIQIADVFDAMREDARRRHEKRAAKLGDDAGAFVPPFTPGQEQAGRSYRDLVERHEAGGVKCASLEAGRRGGGGGEFMDAFIADGILLARIRDRIGRGVAMEVRRIRPSNRGGAARGIITDRELVDQVCLGDMSVTKVLSLHGWDRNAKNIEALRRALACCLDRMQGYRGARSQHMA